MNWVEDFPDEMMERLDRERTRAFEMGEAESHSEHVANLLRPFLLSEKRYKQLLEVHEFIGHDRLTDTINHLVYDAIRSELHVKARWERDRGKTLETTRCHD